MTTTASAQNFVDQAGVAKRRTTPDLIELSQGAAVNAETSSANATSEQPSTDSEMEQNDDSSAIENSDVRRNKYGSPCSTGSESPTPTNSVAVKGGKANLWHGLCEEQRQLLGTEEESSDRHSSDDDPNEEATVHGTLDPEVLYTITEDQRAYYTKQYQTVQRDAAGNVSGPVARVFFEKSRIPVEELRIVWKLCDVTKDGALSQAEFMAAMHLVVLRRNNIQLPVKLPKCLHPDSILHAGGPGAAAPSVLQEADLLHLNDDEGDHVDGGPESINSVGEDRLLAGGGGGGKSEPLQKVPPVAARTGIAAPPQPATAEPGEWAGSAAPTAAGTVQASGWTKFNESPTTSNVSSPGPKPVHFDIQWTVQAVGADPQILHPVALRLTPQGAEVAPAGTVSVIKTDRESSASPSKQSGAAFQNEFRPIQRPQAKKMKKVGIGAIPPPPVRDSQNMMNMSIDSAVLLSREDYHNGNGASSTSSSGEDNSPTASAGHQPQPPIPPPRQPITRHTRSSSLDLNKLLQSTGSAAAGPQSTQLPPEVPPRDSRMESTFADFSQFVEAGKQPLPCRASSSSSATGPAAASDKRPMIPSHRQSAFEVYRKPVSPVALEPEKKMAHLEEMLRSLNINKVRTTGPHPSLVADRDAASTMHQLRDQNGLLVNMCLELGNELAALKYRREEMAIRLQQVGSASRHAVTAPNGSVTGAAASIAVSGAVPAAGNSGGVGGAESVSAVERSAPVGPLRP